MMPLASKSSPHPYLDFRAVLMLFFGFSAGIPILLIFSSLSLWLTEAGVDRSAVTMFGWAALGYSFKFIWSPLVDSLPLPYLTHRFGKRRGWLLLSQLFVIIAIVLMALINPAQQSLALMALAAVLLGFSSATQDIVIDAYRIELAPTAFQPVLSAMYTAGYRIGMIVAGAGALYLADFFGSTEAQYSYLAWRNTYLVMACVMGVGVATTLVAPETQAKNVLSDKGRTTISVMKYYSLITLLPLGLYGIAHLATVILTKIFDIPTSLPAPLASIAFGYAGLVAASLPLVLMWLLSRQTPIAHLDNQYSNSKQHIQLFLTFLLSVIAFIAGFVLVGNILPDGGEGGFSPLVGFLLEVVRFVGATVAAVLVAVALTKAGIVSQSVIKSAWISPLKDFFDRYGKQAGLLLALIGLYRISDIVAGNISNVFYADLGFSKVDIANAVKLMGVIMTIGGGFLGGWIALKVPIMKAMMVGGLLACLTNLLFVMLTNHPGDVLYLYVAVSLDNLAAGFASAVFVAFLSALTSIRFTAVQYALFSSLMTLIPKVLGGYSGSIVNALGDGSATNATGYAAFFSITFLLGLPVLYLIYLVQKRITLTSND